MNKIFSVLAIMAAVGISSQALAASDGEKAFKKCAMCHSIEEGKNKAGPSLFGIFGQEAGTVEGFARYSKALRESDVVWNEESLDAWLENPKKFIAKTRMGVKTKKAETRAALIEYLKSLSAE